jgi:hypothetical protein
MGTSDLDLPESWAPRSCTLPTEQRPVRVAEFDRFFATAVRAVDRSAPTRLKLDLEPSPDVAAGAARLVARETACCSFFTFALIATGGKLQLDVYVPVDHVDVLDALATRVAGAKA